MDFITINKDKFPIVVFKNNPVEPTLEAYRGYLKDMLELLNNHENLIFIMDLSEGKSLSAQMRIEQGNFTKANKELTKKKW